MSAEQREYAVQRLNGRFVIVWWEWCDDKQKELRRRQYLAAKDRPSAEAEAEARWQQGDSQPWSVGRIMTGYLTSIEGKVSHQRRCEAWKAMRPFWEDIEPANITDKMCQRYRATRSISDSTARYELLQLSTALRWGRAEKGIDHHKSFWLPETPERVVRHLTKAEFARFLDAVKADHARLYMMLGVFTLARPSAILDLTWDRVDFMRGFINFTPPGHKQTKKRRTVVPISDELLASLQKGYEARTCEYVIERGGRPVKSIKKAFQAASKRSNVRATPYTLRHTGAVWAAEAGASMSELAQFMGHDDDRTTQQHYARYSPTYLRGVANSISLTS